MKPRSPLFLALAAAVVLSVLAYSAAESDWTNARTDGRRSEASSGDPLGGTTFTVVRGWDTEQTAQALEQTGTVNAEEFISIVNDSTTATELLGEIPPWNSLDGYLLPDTYHIFSSMRSKEIVGMMVRNFRQSFRNSLSWRLRDKEISEAELISVAALVEREAGRTDTSKYASTLLNRLRSGLTLRPDSRGDLGPVREVGDERAAGLRTAPQVNPSLTAMNTVLEAPLTPYMYAVRRPDGFHAFAKTPGEYEIFKERFSISASWVRTVSPVASQPDSQLQWLLEHLAATRLGETAIVVKELTSGRSAAVNEHRKFTSASLWKLPLFVAAFQARDSGELDFRELLKGHKGTVGDAVLEVAQTSDNEAAATLLERLGVERIQMTTKQLNLGDTLINPQSLSRTSGYDMAHLLERLANREFLSERSSKELRDLLILGKAALLLYLPNDIPIAAKVGRLNDVAHDVGIVYTENSTYIIAIMTRGFPDRAAAEESIACISRVVYEYLALGRYAGHLSQTQDPRLTEFVFPVPGAWLPTNESLLPNADRAYRRGIHEGIDFTNGDACVPVQRGAPVVAAKDGIVVRADREFAEMTRSELARVLDRVDTQGYSDAESLDRFRGRQIWIDHGDGVVTRYAHLNDIEDAIALGVRVQSGQLIGHVGNSGSPEGVLDPHQNHHLHFEIRVDGRYLGRGMPINEVRLLLLEAFRRDPEVID